jgi:hypothetical protein
LFCIRDQSFRSRSRTILRTKVEREIGNIALGRYFFWKSLSLFLEIIRFSCKKIFGIIQGKFAYLHLHLYYSTTNLSFCSYKLVTFSVRKYLVLYNSRKCEYLLFSENIFYCSWKISDFEPKQISAIFPISRSNFVLRIVLLLLRKLWSRTQNKPVHMMLAIQFLLITCLVSSSAS